MDYIFAFDCSTKENNLFLNFVCCVFINKYITQIGFFNSSRNSQILIFEILFFTASFYKIDHQNDRYWSNVIKSICVVRYLFPQWHSKSSVKNWDFRKLLFINFKSSCHQILNSCVTWNLSINFAWVLYFSFEHTIVNPNNFWIELNLIETSSSKFGLTPIDFFKVIPNLLRDKYIIPVFNEASFKCASILSLQKAVVDLLWSLSNAAPN